MTFHPYNQENKSLNIFDALYSKHQRVGIVSGNDWKQVLLGSISALVYLQAKDILHNDIKTPALATGALATEPQLPTATQAISLQL